MAFLYSRLLRQTETNIIKSRMLCLTSAYLKIFKIQDEQDFQDRVMKSEKPVVIDFQAS